MTSTQGRSYKDAIALLDTLQSNRTIVSSIGDSSRDMNLDAIPEMLEWTRKAGYVPEEFSTSGLRCIHVAGTKGKGSVCAMVENILRQYRLEEGDSARDRTGEVAKREGLGKIGLYTSPHLMSVRERIRIGGSPISELLFARYFFEIWNRFSDVAATSQPPHPDPTSSSTKPGYFRYLTIMALHVFMKEGVETAIIECGIGGEYDSTNILPPKAVTATAITKLGIDHVGMLGNTIDKIAWHKAGIMKTGVPAFTVPQIADAQAVLEERAKEKNVKLNVVKRYPGFDDGTIRVAAEGDFQKDNASLAIAVAASHLNTLGVKDVPDISTQVDPQAIIPDRFLHALKTVKWAGRCEVLVEDNIEWLIDGAHTVDSLVETQIWYTSKIERARNEERLPGKTMLIFNQQDRDSGPLLRALLPASLPDPPSTANNFDVAVFCTNIPFKHEVVEKDLEGLKMQKMAKKNYAEIHGGGSSAEVVSIEEAVQMAREMALGQERVFVLVTGSLHLVGGVMKVLGARAKERDEVG